MKIDRTKRKVFAAARVDGEYKTICVEYEYDINLDCPQIWKIAEEETGKEVMITLINSEDLEDIFNMIKEVK